ncbi:hypothetical protein C2I18_26860 [Paenibacillus sp. PK3_47]|uniref:hypothetical protein n=1 Tax=Paenibacillus sp. PK3_47 TaxID=2072642 RepID=UPI00201D4F58|nr:hypothetical protein [Paenibacillus sp. PK3_47]UQZ36832.1 hypothetical protein C2I18_26860 [Paenibacillus sp. PK3_47]
MPFWITGEDELEGFVAALGTAKPLAAEPLIDQGIYENEDRKIIYLICSWRKTQRCNWFCSVKG